MSRCLVRFSVLIIVLAFGQGLVLAQIIVGGNGSNTTDSTVYSGSQSLVKTGSNTVTLTAANTYTGGTGINGGVLSVSSLADGSSSSVGTSYVALYGGTLSYTGLGSQTTTRPLWIDYDAGGSMRGGTFDIANASGNLTWNPSSGSILYNVTKTGAGTFTLGGVISSTAALTVNGGTMNLTGANTFTGGTTINAGSLVLGAANRLADTGAVTVNAGTFNLGGFSDTVGAVTLAGGSISNGTLTGSSYAVQSGNVAAVLTGSGALTKSTAGTVNLSAANTYRGNTVVNGGTLAITGAGQIYSGYAWAGGVSTTVNSGAVLEIDRWSGAGSLGEVDYNASLLTLNGSTLRYSGLTADGNGSRGFTVSANGATFDAATAGQTWTLGQSGYGPYQAIFNGSATLTGVGNGVMGQVIGGANAVTKTGTGTWTLAGNNTYTGKTTINGGTLVLGAGSSDLQGWKSDIDINNGSTLSIGGSRFDLSQSASARTITFGSTGGNTLDTGTGVNVVDWAGNTLKTTGGARNFISGSSGINLNSGVTTTLNVARGTDATSDLTVSTVFWNAGGIAKTGNGILTLSAANTYSGTTTVSGGTLIVDTGASIANSSATTVGSGAHLKVNGSAGRVNVNGTLSGSGSVGPLTINSGGLLAVGNSPGLMTATSATWNAGSTFQFEIINATGAAGTDWDLLAVTGALDLASTSASNKVNLIVLSTALQNYVTDTQYSWVFAKAASLTGSAASWTSGLDVTDRFAIDSSGFNGGTQPGRGFKVVTGTDGGLATLSILAVPEPSAASMIILSAGALLALRRRRCV